MFESYFRSVVDFYEVKDFILSRIRFLTWEQVVIFADSSSESEAVVTE